MCSTLLLRVGEGKSLSWRPCNFSKCKLNQLWYWNTFFIFRGKVVLITYWHCCSNPDQRKLFFVFTDLFSQPPPLLPSQMGYNSQWSRQAPAVFEKSEIPVAEQKITKVGFFFGGGGGWGVGGGGERARTSCTCRRWGREHVSTLFLHYCWLYPHPLFSVFTQLSSSSFTLLSLFLGDDTNCPIRVDLSLNNIWEKSKKYFN